MSQLDCKTIEMNLFLFHQGGPPNISSNSCGDKPLSREDSKIFSVLLLVYAILLALSRRCEAASFEELLENFELETDLLNQIELPRSPHHLNTPVPVGSIGDYSQNFHVTDEMLAYESPTRIFPMNQVNDGLLRVEEGKRGSQTETLILPEFQLTNPQVMKDKTVPLGVDELAFMERVLCGSSLRVSSLGIQYAGTEMGPQISHERFLFLDEPKMTNQEGGIDEHTKTFGWSSQPLLTSLSNEQCSKASDHFLEARGLIISIVRLEVMTTISLWQFGRFHLNAVLLRVRDQHYVPVVIGGDTIHNAAILQGDILLVAQDVLINYDLKIRADLNLEEIAAGFFNKLKVGFVVAVLIGSPREVGNDSGIIDSRSNRAPSAPKFSWTRHSTVPNVFRGFAFAERWVYGPPITSGADHVHGGNVSFGYVMNHGLFLFLDGVATSLSAYNFRIQNFANWKWPDSMLTFFSFERFKRRNPIMMNGIGVALGTSPAKRGTISIMRVGNPPIGVAVYRYLQGVFQRVTIPGDKQSITECYEGDLLVAAPKIFLDVFTEMSVNDDISKVLDFVQPWLDQEDIAIVSRISLMTPKNADTAKLLSIGAHLS